MIAWNYKPIRQTVKGSQVDAGKRIVKVVRK
jgi:hypothetical protein